MSAASSSRLVLFVTEAIVVSLGSAILFTATLFGVLLVYIREVWVNELHIVLHFSANRATVAPVTRSASIRRGNP